MAKRFEAIRGDFTGETAIDQLDCPICGQPGRPFGHAPIIDPLHPISVDVLQCTACRHGWITPMPRQAWLNHLYASANRAVIGPGWENEAVEAPTIPEAFVLGQERVRAAGRYFELGVGKGLLYRSFLNAGWACVGVEPGAWGKFPGVIASIDELPSEARFDLLIAFDVLEHVQRPIEFLTRMRAAADPGARLYVSVPNIDSFRARRQKAAWRMVRPLGHTHYFSQASIQRLLRTAGFKTCVVKTNDLFRLRDLRHGLRTAVSGLIQLVGAGDQLLVVATAV